MQRNISMTISLSQKYDKITYFICNPQTKFIVYEKAASFLRRGSLVLLFVVDLFNIQFFQYLFGNSIFMHYDIHSLVSYKRL